MDFGLANCGPGDRCRRLLRPGRELLKVVIVRALARKSIKSASDNWLSLNGVRQIDEATAKERARVKGSDRIMGVSEGNRP